jgi:hypothetical protein
VYALRGKYRELILFNFSLEIFLLFALSLVAAGLLGLGAVAALVKAAA